MSKLLTLEQSAKLATVSYPTVQRWVSSKKIPAVRIGGILRIAEDELEKLIGKPLSREVDPAAAIENSVLHEIDDEKVNHLFESLQPYLIQLLENAPEYGEISIVATLHQGEIGKVRLGSEVTQAITLREGQGKREAKGEGRPS